jgi:hypothetical protein
MKSKIYSIVTVLVISQTLLFVKILEFGNGDFTGYIMETVIVIFAAFVFLRRVGWARWFLLVLMFLLMVTSIMGAVEHDDLVFYLIALLQGIAVYFVYQTKLSRNKQVI